MLYSVKDTTKHVYWNSRENCYVAVMSATPMCRAEGASPAEAIENVERAYAQDNYPQGSVRQASVSRSPGYMLVS